MCNGIQPGRRPEEWLLLSQAERQFVWDMVAKTRGEFGIALSRYVDAEQVRQVVTIECDEEETVLYVVDGLLEIQERLERLERCLALPAAGVVASPELPSFTKPNPEYL